MKKFKLIFISLILLYIQPIYSMNNVLKIGIGGGAGLNAYADVYFLEYEKLLNDYLSTNISINKIYYKYNSNLYWEKGNGIGISPEISLYLNNYYLGIGVSYWQLYWEYFSNSKIENKKRKNGSAKDIHLFFNYRIYYNENIIIYPKIQIGSWFDNNNENGLYGLFKISIGFKF